MRDVRYDVLCLHHRELVQLAHQAEYYLPAACPDTPDAWLQIGIQMEKIGKARRRAAICRHHWLLFSEKPT